MIEILAWMKREFTFDLPMPGVSCLELIPPAR